MSKLFFKKIHSLIPINSTFPLNHMIPVYHCVSNERLPHIKNVINYKNCKDFENDLDYMLKKFDFVDWDSFKKNYNKKNTRPYALLTFDDGLIEFKDVIMPILLRKGIYAINFINPAFVDNSDMMFRLKASLLIEKINKENYKIPKSVSIFLGLKKNSKSEAIAKIKSVDHNNRQQLINIGQLLDFDFKEYIKNNKIYLDEKDLSFVKKEGFGIASHSWDHPYFYDLSLEKQLEKTQQSLNYIQERGFMYEVFAFPFTDFGIKKNFFEKLFDKNKDLEFTFGTAGIKLDSISKNLHRIPMENGFSAKEELNFEINYYQIKKLFNKNIILRS